MAKQTNPGYEHSAAAGWQADAQGGPGAGGLMMAGTGIGPQRASRYIRQAAADERSYSTAISKVAGHLAMVDQFTRILGLADELQRLPEPSVLAVVDSAERPVGYITRSHLLSTLGKPYGRDILSRSPIRDLCFPVRCFDRNANLFTIVEELTRGDAGSLPLDNGGYHALTDARGRFSALFSGSDLMGFLSRMTQEDIEMAARLQERMIGNVARLGGPDWRFHAWCNPAKGVGGDFYLAKELPGGRWFFTLCDVSGKGVAASILSSMVWGMLSMYDFRQGLRQLIMRINEAVITTFQLERYLTGVFMVWDPAARRLHWADMGHSHICVSRAGRTRTLAGKNCNLPIGLEPGLEPKLCALSLQPGDRIFVFTDGITEQENPSRQEFGEDRLFGLLDDRAGPWRDTPAAATDPSLAARIPAIMDGWRQTIPQQDDMSFVLLELED